MSLPDQTPKLPKLPFLVGDAALLALAWLIVHQSQGPLSNFTIGAVTISVIAAGVIGIIPFLTDYARKQDEALDERQRGLEALSRTVNTAAEQISIAANGLHEIVELSHKHLKHAEQLPHKLQEKIAEFNAQLDNAREDDREELEKELTELRASESERLQIITDKINKAVTELTRLEATTQKHITSRVELVDRASATLTKAHADATVALDDTVAAVTRELAAAQARALAEIDARLAARTTEAVAALERAAVQAATTLAAAAAAIAAPAAAPASAAAIPAAPADSPVAPEIASPPRRPRKARRDDTAPVEPVAATPEAAPAAVELPGAEPVVAPVESPAVEPTAATAVPVVEPPPVPLETIAHIAPVASASADPFPAPPAGSPAAAAPAEPAVESPAAAASVAPPLPAVEPPAHPGPLAERPPRKRAARKPATPAETESSPAGDSGEFTLQSDDPPVTTADFVESVISSDGATRLIATAYIGIGNRLFIRGDGPGLSWDKGVPLQFVSIGKWRWETAEATASISFKLYKNDEIECAGLGALTLEPGHQQEVTAKF